MLSDAYRGPHVHSLIRLIGGSASSLGWLHYCFLQTMKNLLVYFNAWEGSGAAPVRAVWLTRVALLFWPLVCFPLQSVDPWRLPRLVAPN